MLEAPMPDLLPAIERDFHDLTGRATRTLGRLAAYKAVSGPTFYQQAIREFGELRQTWEDHRARLSRSLKVIVSHDPHFAAFAGSINQDAAAIGDQLKTMSSAGWPRNSEVGVSALRVRGKDTLTTVLRQLERERAALLPLLNHECQFSRALAICVARSSRAESEMAKVAG
jgi:hypothetical protein